MKPIGGGGQHSGPGDEGDLKAEGMGRDGPLERGPAYRPESPTGSIPLSFSCQEEEKALVFLIILR